MKDTTPEKAIQKRMDNNKQLISDQLKKVPVVEVACEKIGIGRATYYRWRKEDEEFAKLADEAITEGDSLVNDMAESQLMSAIRDKNLTAIIFWLKYHHPRYATKVEISGHLKHEERLTPEQETLVMKALKLAALLPTVISGEISEDIQKEAQP